MQYIEIHNEDLKAGYRTFLLGKQDDRIDFFAYTGDTAINANEQGLKTNAYLRGYFLRKGFSNAVRNADPNIMEPIYKDNENRDVSVSSVDEALDLIYSSKLNISGFKFKKGLTDEQKEQAFGKVIDSFVSASKNLDFSSEKNLFIVQGSFLPQVAYNNGGSQNMEITGVDVQERLGLDTQDVKVQQKLREINRVANERHDGTPNKSKMGEISPVLQALSNRRAR